MKYRSTIAYTSLIASLFLAGCATDNAQTKPTQAAQRQVPVLKVALDCGSCIVRPNVPSLIVEGYNAAAKKAGAKVSLDQQATATIKGYTDRSDTARFLAGALAGKDEIQASIVTADKKFEVEDYYRNAWQGIETLATNIGEMIFEKIAK